MTTNEKTEQERELDAATVEVIRKYLTSAANEMERTLIRTAYNAIVYEVKDFGISIYDRDLNLLADSPGVTLFLGANDYSIQKAVEYIGEDNLEPGDVILSNYPYWSSRHPQDACIFSPVFHEGEIIGYPVVRSHWVDIGQKEQDYVLDSTDVHQEGLLIPGFKLFKGGERDEELFELLRYNTRSPTKVMGDLNAQISAVETGKERLKSLHEKYGREKIETGIDRILSHGRNKSIEATRELPDGTWSAVDYLDSDGINDELVRMEAEVTIDDDEFVIDLSGSSEAVEGPFNVPIGLTESFCKLCFKGVTTPTDPSNGGQYEPLSVIAPEDNLFNATYPAPTYAITTAVAAVDVVFKALAPVIPDRIPASTGGDICNLTLYRTDPETGETAVQGTNEAVGWGAMAERDGNNGMMHFSETTIRNVPVEVYENQLPVRINRLELRQDSAGAGEHRGGLGVRRDYEALAPIKAKSFQVKTRTEGWGLNGGGPGDRNAIVHFPDYADDNWQDRYEFLVHNNDLYEDTDQREYSGMFKGSLIEGERISNRSGGGGGFGDPFDRDPKAVATDVKNGYVSRERAREIYGVAVTQECDVDWDGTEELRGQ
ncbi:hydantoinase B/oxoprolinase family protein [Halobellus sp. GM3]|uniref:hydantoinase B/oxoprolinase family protein n=1 Tax=Halobellus sp. GM3 TaxID=3458410 RepID=UPI00403E0642